ncbi:penicillin-binding protein activator [Colwellia sp. MSW7]|uniref:Penicillin-binding protein activator n=1 Tax=Colwellia maritima TaxID=2912588 RepID=A0ABS9X412_9GAMM|nr:penicillin-binding protein activator [Colwellia maritima]MCI2284990.1 penicillin-binding protein activator [Colwellia maritima]
MQRHPAMAIIPQLQAGHPFEQTIPDPIENIAVLLPLTGGQQKAGLAAQQGILAAYDNNPNTNVFFIDTNQIIWKNIGDNFTKLKIDHIIGPLLKSNVEALLNESMQQTALQIPTLLLNLPSQHSLAPYQAALSMRPEDEAVQAAATLSQHNYEHPIVLSHNDRVSKRIAIAFRDQWQSSTGDTVDIVYFDQGQQMQASLKDSLDVNASQTRISQLNSRLKYNIESEPRNRRDIDMIYLVGTAAQTRLIKPYIDVNTSPFSDVIPVYASSRSHSDFNDKNTASSMNDLQGLTFTQIPWLLNSKQQNKELNRLSDELWPKRTDSLSRIFAMGVDSYQLMGKVSLMKQYPYIRHFGQTGELQLNKANILTRSLVWGQYKNDKVIQVAME